MKFEIDFKRYPRDKKTLLLEINRAFDAYDADELGDIEFIRLMCHYRDYAANENWLGEEDHYGHFKIHSTAKQLLGKNRSKRLEKVFADTISIPVNDDE